MSLTNKQIKEKWIEIVHRNPSKGCIISSVTMAIELARWVEAETQKAAMTINLPERCDCGRLFDSTGECQFCGAHARYP